MAYISKDWQRVNYRNQYLTGIKEKKTDKTKFLFVVFLKQKVRKKIITINGNEKDRYQIAIQKYNEFRIAIYNGYFLQPVTFQEMFERWLSMKLDTRWKKQQRGIYKNHIKEGIGSNNLREIKSKDIDNIMIQIKSLSSRTRKAILAIIKSSLKLAVDEKHITSSPIESRHSVTVNALEQKTVILDAVNLYQRVYSSILKVFVNDPKWRAIFLLGLNGRRKSEILLMEWEHVSFESQTYIIPGRHSKIKQTFSFTIPKDVLAALREIRPGEPAGLIFPNPRTGKPYTDIRNKVQEIRTHSNYSDFGFHRMRNLMSSALFAKGVSASHLSSILGHSSPEILKQYLTMQREKSCQIVEDASQKLLNQKDNYAAV